MRLIHWVIFLGLLGAGIGWWISRPQQVEPAQFAGLTGDPVHGETVFWAAGCASCHAAPDAKGDDILVLSGGYRIDSPFGTFVAPNISPSPQGIGGWTNQDMANALLAGVSPSGQHYYPSLPYGTYVRMQPRDVADLKSFLDTLPLSDAVSAPHELGFPFTLRRGLGLWKQVNLDPGWVMANADTPELQRGRYLVEALAHCAECHTPRDWTGGLDRSRWMQGAPNPSGKGTIPALSPDKLTWDAAEIAYYLETGFTPDYDSAGGQMAKVVTNMAKLTPQDRMAIATYIKALPPGN
jgi:mono/diheme cytochrome c family protein